MSRYLVVLIRFVTGVVVCCFLAGSLSAEKRHPVPRCTKLSWIEASIRALNENGVTERVSREHGMALSDGTRALPLKHVVGCETAAACERVSRWARRSGFAPSRIVTEYGHGGFAHYQVHLRQLVPLVDRRVQAEAVRIHQALQLLTGARYDTWMLDVDPEGGSDER